MLWSQYKDESGLVNIPLYKEKLITPKPVYMKQYPLSPENVEVIQSVIYLFFKQNYCPHSFIHLTIHQSIPAVKLMERVGV